MTEEKRKMSTNEIIVAYHEGQRNFSNIVLKSANLENIYLEGANFSNSDLSNTSFARSNLMNANFEDCNLQRATFETSFLKNAKFDNSDMQWAILKNAFFENTSLRECKLSWAHLCKDDLAKADLKGADLSMVCIIDSNITGEQWNQIPQETKWTLKVKSDKDTDVPAATSKGLSYVDSSKGPEYGGRQQGVDVYKKTSSSSSAVYGVGGTKDEAAYNTTKTVSNDPHDLVGSNEYILKQQEEIRKQQEGLRKMQHHLLNRRQLK